MKVSITRKAEKELDSIPDPVARTITARLRRLSSDPHPQSSKKLSGKENYRLRIGSYRAIYTVNKRNKEITVLRIAHRKTIYR